MIIIVLFMLLAPGLISVRVLWSKKAIAKEDYKFVVCDYVIYSFLIQLVVYAIMFFTYPERTVSFSVNMAAISHVLSASFVFKYSLVALISAIILPAFLPWLIKFWQSLEDKRGNRGKRKAK